MYSDPEASSLYLLQDTSSCLLFIFNLFLLTVIITTIESRNFWISTANLWFANKFQKEICRFLLQWYSSKKSKLTFCPGWIFSREKVIQPFLHTIIIIKGTHFRQNICGKVALGRGGLSFLFCNIISKLLNSYWKIARNMI